MEDVNGKLIKPRSGYIKRILLKRIAITKIDSVKKRKNKERTLH